MQRLPAGVERGRERGREVERSRERSRETDRQTDDRQTCAHTHSIAPNLHVCLFKGDARSNRVREPRSIRPDNIVRPYSAYEAHGVVLLAQMKRHMSKGQMDRYVMHYVLRGRSSSSTVIGAHRAAVWFAGRGGSQQLVVLC